MPENLFAGNYAQILVLHSRLRVAGETGVERLDAFMPEDVSRLHFELRDELAFLRDQAFRGCRAPNLRLADLVQALHPSEVKLFRLATNADATQSRPDELNSEDLVSGLWAVVTAKLRSRSLPSLHRAIEVFRAVLACLVGPDAEITLELMPVEDFTPTLIDIGERLLHELSLLPEQVRDDEYLNEMQLKLPPQLREVASVSTHPGWSTRTHGLQGFLGLFRSCQELIDMARAGWPADREQADEMSSASVSEGIEKSDRVGGPTAGE